MIQDILGHKYNLAYKNIKPNDDSIVLCYKKGYVCLNSDKSFIKYKDLLNEKVVFGFMVDDISYFISLDDVGFTNFPINLFREIEPRYLGFIIITGYHLYNYYITNKYCSRCGKLIRPSVKIRSLKCTCGNEVFPTIAPAVIIGLLNKDHTKIMLTKYRIGYNNYALVAGYTEIGETFEDTVRREVMEEVGLSVNNVCYYKSQPWGLSGSVLAGFWADISDSDDNPNVDLEELKLAKWVSRDEIEVMDDGVSLTREMINYFKSGKKIDL